MEDMEMRTILEGDIVTVVWSDESIITGKVIYTPAATGDLWYIETEKRIYAINPGSTAFDCIIKELVE